ncbi:xanthine dehydrogenase/oxidase-like [Phlebotomus argentipes]|uniref:xanthine dehydrogenase/oxidase-like n=1 Tax=Phlebotomus argentipes TaxID=94469 RepID=UPI002892FD0E|nr:xanthine dehydrogenase/oxidase-like [Phlebotomus argentipes]
MISGVRSLFQNPELCSELCLTINGVIYKAAVASIPIDTSLNTFIRRHANLRGTKFMCLEGGCGVCIVTIRGIHPTTRQPFILSVNSCLLPVYSCHGLEVITVEALGSRKAGYHPIQSRLAALNGSQCGFCTPGMVMSMFSLVESERGQLTMAEVENAFGGNLCRCTGYRPILDAFKTVASDATQRLRDLVCDIEDMPKFCPKMASHRSPFDPIDEKRLFFKCKSGREWHKAYNLATLFTVMRQSRHKQYMLVAGNTAHGVYRRDPNIELFIDISSIEALRTHTVGGYIEMGGNMTLTETMIFLRRAAFGRPQFGYVHELVRHLDLVAHVAVRNIGTLAGNLMIKHEHPDFPSDVFLILETVGAMLIIAENVGRTRSVSVANFLKMDMKRRIILKIRLPAMDPVRDILRTFKIMPRAQNSHAYVNAGFLFKFTESRRRVLSAKICYGGIHPRFVHAATTEQLLQGADIFDNDVLQRALQSLDQEIQPDSSINEPLPEFRKILALGLFYKAVLSVGPQERIQEQYRSGGTTIERPVSSGIQQYTSNSENYPLTQPLPKDTALEQTAGEAVYVNDMAHLPDDLWATFVIATQTNSRISYIDPSVALKIPGVIAFFRASDIPGVNNCMSRKHLQAEIEEEIFASSEILYHAQPVGMIVAESFDIAQLASKKVKIIYERSTTDQIFLTPTDVLEANEEDRIERNSAVLGEQNDDEVEGEHTITGRFVLGSQYHFHMEAQTVICTPSEQGLDVYAASQWMDLCQTAIAQCLGIHESRIKMEVRRLGGGFGGKIYRVTPVACAAAIAAFRLNRTVRFVMTIEQNMMSLGKRYYVESEYEVVTDANGQILKLENTIYEDLGCNFNENIPGVVLPNFSNGYVTDNWYWQYHIVRTHKPSNTMVRSPGTLEFTSMIENIMQHIAAVTGQDPIDVRLANMPEDTQRRQFISDFRTSTNYNTRKTEIDEFNTQNRWKKRGIAMVPMNYRIHWLGIRYALVSIHHGDGSVTVTHGGTEMGQGINTKVAQATAHLLGIDYNLVKVMPSLNYVSPNTMYTAASITTASVIYAIQQACQTLNDRINPIRDDNSDLEWPELIQRCFEQDVDLTASYMFKHSEMEAFHVFGISCAEIELDVLTGNFLIRRVDILQDTGESVNPLLDVGQIEGGFVFGLGYWLHEKLIYNDRNGKLMTNRTWNYKIPGAKDIPVDFRVAFIQDHNPDEGVLRAKPTGEPTTALAIVVPFAIRYALNSARSDAGYTDPWFNMGAPSTIEEILLLAGNSTQNFQV